MSAVKPTTIATWPNSSGTQISAIQNEKTVSFVLEDRNLHPCLVFKTVIGWITPETLAEIEDAALFYQRLRPIVVKKSILIFSIVDNEYISDANPSIRLLVCIENQRPTLRCLSQKRLYRISPENITGVDPAYFCPIQGKIDRDLLEHMQSLQLSSVDLKKRTIELTSNNRPIGDKCKLTRPSKKTTKLDWHSLLGLMTPRTYFEKCDPSIFRTLAVAMQIFIRVTGIGIVTIEVEASDSIEEVWRVFEKKMGCKFSNEKHRISYGCRTLDFERTLSDYGITDRAGLEISPIVRGGALPPINFSNVSESNMKSENLDRGKDVWRIVKPGLNLLGICINAACKTQAFKDKKAAVPKNFSTFDMRNLQTEAKCPCCNEALQDINCGFTKCYFSVEAVTEQGNTILINRKRAPDDQLLMFDDDEDAKINYEYLKIKTEEIPSSGCTLQ